MGPPIAIFATAPKSTQRLSITGRPAAMQAALIGFAIVARKRRAARVQCETAAADRKMAANRCECFVDQIRMVVSDGGVVVHRPILVKASGSRSRLGTLTTKEPSSGARTAVGCGAVHLARRAEQVGIRVWLDHTNGLRMVRPRMVCPSCMCSV